MGRGACRELCLGGSITVCELREFMVALGKHGMKAFCFKHSMQMYIAIYKSGSHPHVNYYGTSGGEPTGHVIRIVHGHHEISEDNANM